MDTASIFMISFDTEEQRFITNAYEGRKVTIDEYTGVVESDCYPSCKLDNVCISDTTAIYATMSTISKEDAFEMLKSSLEKSFKSEIKILEDKLDYLGKISF